MAIHNKNEESENENKPMKSDTVESEKLVKSSNFKADSSIKSAPQFSTKKRRKLLPSDKGYSKKEDVEVKKKRSPLADFNNSDPQVDRGYVQDEASVKEALAAEKLAAPSAKPAKVATSAAHSKPPSAKPPVRKTAGKKPTVSSTLKHSSKSSGKASPSMKTTTKAAEPPLVKQIRRNLLKLLSRKRPNR